MFRRFLFFSAELFGSYYSALGQCSRVACPTLVMSALAFLGTCCVSDFGDVRARRSRLVPYSSEGSACSEEAIIWRIQLALCYQLVIQLLHPSAIFQMKILLTSSHNHFDNLILENFYNSGVTLPYGLF